MEWMDPWDDAAWRKRRRRTARLVQAVWKIVHRTKWGPGELESVMRLTWVKSGTRAGEKHYNNPKRLTWWSFERLFGAQIDPSLRWPVSADTLMRAGVPGPVAKIAADECGMVGLRTAWWGEEGPWIDRNWGTIRRTVTDATRLPKGDKPRVDLARRIHRLPRIPFAGDESRGAHPREA